MDNIIKDVDVQQSAVGVATIAAAGEVEIPVFVAPFDCFLNKICITNQAGLVAADTDYTTLTFKRKGSAGTGTDEIGSITNGPAATGESLVAFVPKDIGALNVLYRYIPKGTAVTCDKVKTGGGAAITYPVFTVDFVRA